MKKKIILTKIINNSYYENLESNLKDENVNPNNSIKYETNNTINKEINILNNNISSNKSYGIKLDSIKIFLSIIALIFI